MSWYYRGRRAQIYDKRWHTFTQKTLEEVMVLVDMATLQHMYQQTGPFRILDVACGTGVLLIGLLLNRFLGWWWADPLAGLALVYFLLREGQEAWHEARTGETCSYENDDCDDN